ncbi:MAG: sigma-70 family RNA polymerase sigma factor [Acidobacteriaceae bacterium]|nr:sigma-70 family RNA polymerase sigma factor [Acidobacteriaceae bacterium]
MAPWFWKNRTAQAAPDGDLPGFEQIALPHLNAAYNLARWLTRNEHDAEDIVQEAYLRALRAFATFNPDCDARAWLLKIVRNTGYTWLRRNRPKEMMANARENAGEQIANCLDPESALLEKSDFKLLREALGEMPAEYREALILRELEGLSYREISDITSAPVGTVMSRLFRARRDLCARLSQAMRGVRG